MVVLSCHGQSELICFVQISLLRRISTVARTEKINKLLLTKVAYRDRNFKVKYGVGCVLVYYCC